MKKKELNNKLKFNKVEIANLKVDNIFGGISGKQCNKSIECSDDCPIDDDPSNVYTGGLDTNCVSVVC